METETVFVENPQSHKEAGFDRGWASHFDTWYKLGKELGFVYYWRGEKNRVFRKWQNAIRQGKLTKRTISIRQCLYQILSPQSIQTCTQSKRSFNFIT